MAYPDTVVPTVLKLKYTILLLLFRLQTITTKHIYNMKKIVGLNILLNKIRLNL